MKKNKVKYFDIIEEEDIYDDVPVVTVTVKDFKSGCVYSSTYEIIEEYPRSSLAIILKKIAKYLEWDDTHGKIDCVKKT